MIEFEALLPRLASGAIASGLFHAGLLCVVETFQRGRPLPSLALWFLELGAIGFMVIWSPHMLYGPIALLLAATAVGGVFVSQAFHSRACSPVRPDTRSSVILTWVGWSVLALPAVVSLAAWLKWIAPYSEGVDFYYYILWARDRIAGDAEAALGGDLYLPGVYVFWGTVLRAAGGIDLSVLHAVVHISVFAMALVSAVASWRAGADRLAVTLVFFSIIALASRIEGFVGVTEPLVSTAFMAGVALWGGSGLQTRRDSMSRLGLALWAGVAIWFKIQGILLLAGFSTLALADFVLSSNGRERFRAVAAGVVSTLVSLAFAVALVLLDGRGLAPIRGAVGWGRDYRIEGGFLELVRPFLNECGWLLAAGTFTLLPFILSPPLRKRNPMMLRVVALNWGATVATLYQYTRRAYLHYGLLTLAPAMVCAAIGMTLVIKRFRPRSGPVDLLRWCLVTLVALVVGRGNADGSTAWVPLDWPRGLPRHVVMRHDPSVKRDLDELCAWVRPGEDVVVLPARRNFVHVLCDTVPRSRPERYAWVIDPGGYRRTLAAPDVDRLIVFSDIVEYPDQLSCGEGGCAALVRDLSSLGFSKVHEWETFSFYRRWADPGAE